MISDYHCCDRGNSCLENAIVIKKSQEVLLFLICHRSFFSVIVKRTVFKKKKLKPITSKNFTMENIRENIFFDSACSELNTQMVPLNLCLLRLKVCSGEKKHVFHWRLSNAIHNYWILVNCSLKIPNNFTIFVQILVVEIGKNAIWYKEVWYKEIKVNILILKQTF